METENKLGILDKYISTTNIFLHTISITVATLVVLIGTIILNNKHLQVLFFIGTVLMMLAMFGAYTISKRIKTKKNKLNQHKIKFIWKLIYVLVSVVWMCIISMMSGVIYVMIVMHTVQ